MTSDIDWQSNKSVTECNRHMWENQISCDVTFITGEGREPVGAHKYVLISRSCVFYAMFAGPLHGNADTVTVPEVEAAAFKQVLLFLYTGDDIKVDFNNVLSLLYISKKYCVQTLIDKCLHVLTYSIESTNVCTVMETAHIYDEENLRLKCRNLILQEAEVVFKSGTLVELCAECLGELVKADDLPLAENVVFEAVMEYSVQKCKLNDVEVMAENQQKIVANVLKHIRYPIMDTHYFVDTVEPSGILNTDDCLNIIKYFLNPEVNYSRYNSKRRIMRVCASRFVGISTGWGYKRDKIDAINFTSSKDVLIHGIQIYGSSQGQGHFKVKLSLQQEIPSLRRDLYFYEMAYKHVSISTHSAQKVYNILFEKPVFVQKSKECTFLLIMSGPATYFGGCGQDKLDVGAGMETNGCPFARDD